MKTEKTDPIVQAIGRDLAGEFSRQVIIALLKRLRALVDCPVGIPSAELHDADHIIKLGREDGTGEIVFTFTLERRRR